ncbi:PAS domain S-box protein [Parabacteroides sp. FAFU027]|uniref:PAS domain S-box protein n=1 Tax=Parabacteroides sp. FAFU027 TaxID=2922715 RepID=UPI001FAF05EE|nr:PAS domain S-box protein [Parabacteroides sp. FAFU027]
MFQELSKNTSSHLSDHIFNTLFDNMPLPLVLSKLETGEIIRTNRFFRETFNLEESEVVSKTSTELGIWKDSNRDTFMRRLIREQNVNGFELDFKNLKGEDIHTLINATLLEMNGQKLLLTMAIDITHRKRSEKALRLSEEKFRSLFEDSPGAIAILNLDTTIAEVNDVYCRISGYSREELIGMSWTEQIPADELDRLKEYNRRRLVDPQDAPSEYELTFYNKAGERKYGIMNVSYLPDSEIIITTFVDITQRKYEEIKLEQHRLELKEHIEQKNKDLTLRLLQLANTNDAAVRLSKKLKQLRLKISTEDNALLEDMDSLILEMEKNQQSIIWKNLNNHLDSSRPQFSSVLLANHPNLTPAEIKLCALLSLNINTKEIAMITNQTYDSIRVSRTRLRKKLGLTNEDNLVAYLLSI